MIMIRYCSITYKRSDILSQSYVYHANVIENVKSVQHITKQPHKICISYTAFTYYNYKMKKTLGGDANTAPQLACGVITIGQRVERAKKTNAKSKLRVGLQALAGVSVHCPGMRQSSLRQQQLVARCPLARSIRCRHLP